MIGILPQALRGKEAVLFEDVVPSLRGEGGDGIAFKACHWFSTYRIHHRVTERFRDRRCFLLGDAAHIHSPVGAQGMNTGLQDAYNLGWKLALAVSGRASDSLLDTYEAERLPVAQRLFRPTDRAFELIVSDNWLGSLFRTRILPASWRLRWRANVRAGLHSARCPRPASPLSREPTVADSRQTVERAPRRSQATGSPGCSCGSGQEDHARICSGISTTQSSTCSSSDNARPLAIWVRPLTGSSSTSLRAMATMPESSRAQGYEGPAFYLLRPDGHVGLAGAHLDPAAVHRWFEALGLSPSACAASDELQLRRGAREFGERFAWEILSTLSLSASSARCFAASAAASSMSFARSAVSASTVTSGWIRRHAATHENKVLGAVGAGCAPRRLSAG